MTTIDTARLRALSEAATHQRWHATAQGGIEADDYDGPGEVFDSVASVHDSADWEYIEAADPQTMLALLDRLEAAERRADQAEATAEHLHDEDSREIVALTQERDDLAAVVEKVRIFIERQSGWFRYRAEPVSTVLATAPADAGGRNDE